MRHTAVPLLLVLAVSAAAAGEARYTVRLSEASPPRFQITAVLPAGKALRMETTRPGDLPALLEQGWPALVSGLRVLDGNGGPVAVEPAGDAGWRVPEGTAGPLTASYEVRTEALARADWPAPREAVHAEEGTVSIVGRALFVTTEDHQRSAVAFELPRGWRAVTAWPSPSSIPSSNRLTENLIVLTRLKPDVIRAGGFAVSVVPLGPWRAVRGEVRDALRGPIERFVGFLPVNGTESYLALLLPMQDQGAESYRQSLALTFPETPTAENRPKWANLLAHEVFHYWNGWAMSPADYGRSQWFQEGFTEYTANLAVARDLSDLERRLATHVVNARRLTTSMEETGGRKGPPLYSAGALVAFAWDVRIREATSGARDLRDFFGALWRKTERGSRAWGRADLVAALQETAPGDWEAFLDTYVKGTTPLPYGEILARAGFRLVDSESGEPLVQTDPAATGSARVIRGQLVTGR